MRITCTRIVCPRCTNDHFLILGVRVSCHCNRWTSHSFLPLGAVPRALPSMPVCGWCTVCSGRGMAPTRAGGLLLQSTLTLLPLLLHRHPRRRILLRQQRHRGQRDQRRSQRRPHRRGRRLSSAATLSFSFARPHVSLLRLWMAF